MISDPESYFRQFIPQRDPLLQYLEDQAKREGIPTVGPVVGELLFLLVRAVNAARVLELGTAHGYSAIYLARGIAHSRGSLVTVEKNKEMAVQAGENLKRAGVGSNVEIIAGEAVQVMKTFSGPFDFIFMDIDKEGYKAAAAQCRRLLRLGGTLIADNTAFQDADDFNRGISSDPHWRCVHLYSFLPEHSPEYDGLIFAVRI